MRAREHTLLRKVVGGGAPSLSVVAPGGQAALPSSLEDSGGSRRRKKYALLGYIDPKISELVFYSTTSAHRI